MSRPIVRALFVVAMTAIAMFAAEAEHVPGRLLAELRRDAAPAAIGRALLAHRASLRRQIPELSVATLEIPADPDGTTLAALRRSGVFEYVEPDYYGHTAGEPNDPSYIAQWHLRRIGGPLAWSLSTGSASVIVAVIDSGVYPHHPDLAGKLVAGWNFVKNSADTTDVLGHGTAVAGTVAAATNNSIGVAGVNWQSRVMPLVVVDDKDYAAYSDIAAAIQYAADHGARVINVSIGGTAESYTLQKAVDYAWSKGALVFASAMNQSTSTRYYPAACAHAVAISATDANDRLASFSNYGSWITLSAPGTGILTTADGGGYAYWSGTSFASPIAAGVAALVFSVNPSLTAADALALLEKTADQPSGSNSGLDPYFGWGRVNAYRAVLAANPPHLRSGTIADPPARRVR